MRSFAPNDPIRWSVDHPMFELAPSDAPSTAAPGTSPGLRSPMSVGGTYSKLASTNGTAKPFPIVSKHVVVGLRRLGTR